MESLANNLPEEFSNFRIFGIGKQSEQEKAWAEKRAIAKEERHTYSAGDIAENIAMKVPMAPVRAGFLAGLRLNIFGLSRKLYPAILSEDDAKKKHYDLENRKVAIKKLLKIEKLYFRLGGRSESIEKNIRVGFDRPIFHTKNIKKAQAAHKSSFNAKTDEFSNVVGYDDAAEVASGLTPLGSAAGIAGGLSGGAAAGGGLSATTIVGLAGAGASAVGAIAKGAKGNDAAKDNPFAAGSPEYLKAQADIEAAQAGGYLNPNPPVADSEIDKLLNEKGKILGMSPLLFYGICAVALIGVFVGIKKVKGKK